MLALPWYDLFAYNGGGIGRAVASQTMTS